ncbi:MAG TPA: hypothetical protein VHA33_05850 [Candidatus Angelobacter sp.]|jgi:hypothetical protein|nr:hypothetical protein [Candidatus Angelobacter sp.]
MAEIDGNTVPTVQPSDMHRSLKTTPSELLPLEPAVFEVIHRLNSRFDRILHDFRGLQTFPFFPHHKLTAWQNLLGLIQAETNFALSGAIHERAGTNALYFDRLCAHRERELADPDDVLLEAEYRKQELADQEKLAEEEPVQNEPTNI